MLLGKIFERFVNGSPLSVMLRGTLEYALQPGLLDQLFLETARHQYTHKLLFSTLVDLTSLVVCRIHPSHHAAYQAEPAQVGVSLKALYDKLDHTEPTLSANLVRHIGERLLPVLQELNAGLPPRLPGYWVRILDGNHLASTQHRLKELRPLRSGPLPGQALVVYDPQWLLISHVVPCEDGYTQERALLAEVLPLAQAQDVWVADRNFCTTDFLFGLHRQQSFFVIRQHAQNLRWRLVGKRRRCGRSATGEVSEQAVVLQDEDGSILTARRVTVQLDKPTRNGDTELHILTNLPKEDADALTVAELYRGRWTIEIAFGELAATLSGEINTLAYPKAALFCFCVALAAFNVLSVLKGALRAAHGAEKVTQEVSAYYMAQEIARTYDGMMIAIPEEFWQRFAKMTAVELGRVLKDLAQRVRLQRLRKHPRGPKKPVIKKPKNKKQPHVSTARELEKRKKTA
jgi:Transposase DDE domain